MEHKVSPKLYSKYLVLLKPKVYSEIITIRQKFGIPDYGIIPSKIIMKSPTIMLGTLANSSYIKGREKEFLKSVEHLIRQNDLLPSYSKFVKLFIFYDVGAPYYNKVAGLVKFEAKQKDQEKFEVNMVLRKDHTAKEWASLYKDYIKPLLDGKYKFKELYATTPEHLQIYYWTALRGLTATPYLKKFHPDIHPIRTSHQNRINAISRDMEDKIMAA